MNKSKLLATAFAVAALSFTNAQAATSKTADQGSKMADQVKPSDKAPDGMEKCKVVDKDGKGLIKEHMSDCKSVSGKSSSCAGQNKAADADAWILVPAGECDKINNGDLSGVSDEIKAKIDTSQMAN